MSEAAARPRDERFVLAVDLGSSALKIGLVSLTGRIAWWRQTALQTTHGPGRAVTQDAHEWWRLVVAGARRGLAESSVAAEQVVAVALTGQYASTVPVDSEGRPVAPVMMWMDTRGEPHSRRLIGGRVEGYNARRMLTFIRHTGGGPSPTGGDPIGHMLHWERDEPDVAGVTRWYLEPVDYLAMCFTGVPAASHASMTAAWLTDNRNPEVLAYDHELTTLAGVDPAKLPPLVATGSLVGKVQPSVASRLGISPDVVVVTGITDVHSAAMGSGCVRDYEAHIGLGTTTWVSAPVPRKKTDVFRQMAALPGLSPGHYLLVNSQSASGRSLQWFRDEVAAGFGPGEAWPFDRVTELAGTAPAGSGGVIFTPWLAGERGPVDDARARGGFHNLSLTTTRAELARSVLEGAAFNARWLLEAADHFTGRRLEPLRLFGGGARSDLWCQILADVFDRRVDRLAEPVLTGLRGCGLWAGTALGAVTREEVRDLVPVDTTFLPNATGRATYDRLFAEFPRLYKAQRRMFHRLNG